MFVTVCDTGKEGIKLVMNTLVSFMDRRFSRLVHRGPRHLKQIDTHREYHTKR